MKGKKSELHSDEEVNEKLCSHISKKFYFSFISAAFFFLLIQSGKFDQKQSDSVGAGCEDGAHSARCARVIL